MPSNFRNGKKVKKSEATDKNVIEMQNDAEVETSSIPSPNDQETTAALALPPAKLSEESIVKISDAEWPDLETASTSKTRVDDMKSSSNPWFPNTLKIGKIQVSQPVNVWQRKSQSLKILDVPANKELSISIDRISSQEQLISEEVDQQTVAAGEGSQILISTNDNLGSLPSSAGPKGDAPLEFAIPKRNITKCGRRGRQTAVEVNFLSLNILKLAKTAIHYDVVFEPDKPKPILRYVFNKMCLEYFPGRYPIFDGNKNVYSTGPLFTSNAFIMDMTITNIESEQELCFKVTMTPTSEVDLTSLSKYMTCEKSIKMPQDALQCIDIIFRNCLANRFVQVGRSFFKKSCTQAASLGEGMEIWHGMFSSSVLGWKPFINIDVAHKGFPTAQPITELIKELKLPLEMPYSDGHLNALRKHVKGLKVRYEIPNVIKRNYRINDLVLNPQDLKFTDDTGKQFSVKEYYEKTRKYKLLYPFLPCLWVGSLKKQIYVLCELCTILPGQVVMKKLSEMQTRVMISETATSTTVRKKKILDAFKESGIQGDLSLKEFGISINNEFEKVPARVLEPPMITYRNNTTVQPKNGVWYPEKFFKGANLEKWAIFNTASRSIQNDQLREFAKNIVLIGKKMGMNIKDLPVVPLTLTNCSNKELESCFDKIKQKNLQLVFVIISDTGELYSKIKQFAELRYAVLTQCIRVKTAIKLNATAISNLLLKVNTKLCGVNHKTPILSVRPAIFKNPVMIIGADVSHPSPEQTEIPSIVGLAASYDPTAFRYNMVWKLQPPKVEIIEELESLMAGLLFDFYDKSGIKPSALILYRDGVSEGQFRQVLNSELTAIRRACSKMNLNYKPSITIMVVQKRHHTRMFPTKQEDIVGKPLNVQPGTVIDTVITHPTELEYYMMSHHSIQGVARPTKYRRLWDDNDMSEDELQQLTFYLCHMFSRCTRSISYPAPTLYAHLAAYRGRVYLEGSKIDLTDLKREQEKRSSCMKFWKTSPMYFI